MLEYKTKTYMKKVTEKVETNMYCDYCGEEIKNGSKFIYITSSHNDWGNDSCDSFKEADLHEECWKKYVDELFTNKPICASLKNRNNWNIHIETEYFHSFKEGDSND